MGDPLFTVEGAHELQNRTVLTPGVPVPEPPVGPGDPIELHPPDGEVLHTTVLSLEGGDPTRREGGRAALGIPPEIRPMDVPEGTVVVAAAGED